MRNSATLLLKNLFDIDLHLDTPGTALLGKFMGAWVSLEQVTGSLATQIGRGGNQISSPVIAFGNLVAAGLISHKTGQELKTLRDVRNRVVHGKREPSTITPEMIDKLDSITKELEQKLPESHN